MSEVQQALHIDAQSDSRPMTHYVESPEDIESIFDDITYSKGMPFPPNIRTCSTTISI